MTALRESHRYLIKGVLVPPRIAWFLDRYLTEVRKSLRGRDEELDAVLLDISYAALDYCNSVNGTDTTASSEPAEQSAEWLTATAVAGRLGITSRAVRKAIADKRLNATKFGGRWQIHRDDADHYRATRTAA